MASIHVVDVHVHLHANYKCICEIDTVCAPTSVVLKLFIKINDNDIKNDNILFLFSATVYLFPKSNQFGSSKYYIREHSRTF